LPGSVVSLCMKKPKLIYIYDAICGWCYGFSPVMQQIAQDYPYQFEYEVLSGGLIQGDRVGPIEKMAPYIKSAYKDVEARTGVVFGDKFVHGTLEKGTMILDSLPAAIALCIVKELKPQLQLKFSHLLHQAIYSDGVEPTVPRAFTPYAALVGIDRDTFEQKMSDSAYADIAYQEFADVGAFGVSGYPALLLEKDEKYYMVAKGYTPYEQIKPTLDYVLAEEFDKSSVKS
jgi:putative protein-disulfide isomerase